MKFIKYIICIFIVSCGNIQSEIVENKEIDYKEICECLSIEKQTDFGDMQKNGITNCMLDYCQGDKKKYYEIIGKTMELCPDYYVKLNNWHNYQVGFDTIEFRPIQDTECVQLNGKWKSLGDDNGMYSIIKNDTSYQYEDYKLSQLWLNISANNCTSKLVVLKQFTENPIPPYVGDTISYEFIGIKGKYVKTLFKWKNLELVSAMEKID